MTDLVFLTNYLTPYQAALLRGADVAVVTYAEPDARRTWSNKDLADGVPVGAVRGVRGVVRLSAAIRSSKAILMGGSLWSPWVILGTLIAMATRRRRAYWLERRRDGQRWKRSAARLILKNASVLAIGSDAAREYSSLASAVTNFPYSYGDGGHLGKAKSRGAEPLVLVVATEWHRKGADIALEAASMVGIRPTVIGGADMPVDPGPVNRALTGVGPSEMQRLLAQADVVVLNSRSDGWGVVVEEGLALGTPCIVSDAAGAAELAGRADPRLVIRSCEPASTAQALAWLLSLTDEQYRALSQRCIDAVRAHRTKYNAGNLRQIVRGVDPC